MCGIVGIFERKGNSIHKAILTAMADTLQHRGPDDSGTYINENVGLGFKRLSIIDLDGGNQPILNEDRSIVVVCNGEIYNYKELRKELLEKGHQFKTNCDVEVLVHLYEEEETAFLNKLNGQFAFAIYDSNKKKLFLGRDQVGIAPLFYSYQNSLFLFASEVKAILEHTAIKRKVNVRGLDQVLTFPGNVSPTTMFEGIFSVKPGHFITVTEEKMEDHLYWDLHYPTKENEISDYNEEYYIETLSDLLVQAVKYRLHADVPVGFYLSGGLDSSLIGAIINNLYPNTRRNSFSITFNDSQIDERGFQRLMANHTRSIHHESCFDALDIADNLMKAVYHAEAPLKETYNTCSLKLSESVKRNNIKVVLTGEGADELFAGYVGYRFDMKRSAGANDFTDINEALEREIREKLWGDKDFIYEKNYVDFKDTKQALYSDGMNGRYNTFDSVCEGLIDKTKLAGRNKLHKRSYLDFKLRLSDHLVADHGDRVSYAHSIEARYPFLDINLIEFATKIPAALKLKNMQEKYILKKCASRYLPSQVIEREKFSFVAPGSPYLVKKNIEWVNDILSYDTIKRQGYFNPDTVERLKKIYKADGFSINQTFESDLLIVILTFGIFLQAFNMPDYN